MKKTITKSKEITIDYGPERVGWKGRSMRVDFTEGQCQGVYIEFLPDDLIPAHGMQISLTEPELLFVHKALHDAWKIIEEEKKKEERGRI